MLVSDVIEELGLTVFSGAENLDKEVTDVVVSDILSDVMAHAKKGTLWVTNQTHENVLAIVFFKSLSGLLLPSGLALEPDAAKKAVEKNLPVLQTSLSAFQVVGKLYALGIGQEV